METSPLKKQKLIKKLKIVEAFRNSGNLPEWMVLEVLPVLPPTLRPLVPLDGGRFATADFNDLYRRVITRNNRLKQLLEIRAPEVILRNEKRMLQEAVDALIDNSKKSRPVKGRGSRALKSLTDQLKGKQGRFRQNLLGKRVDYSGRSVITVGPELKIYQCGLPKEMAKELFKPFIIERLEKIGAAEKAKTAKKMIEKNQPEIWKILEEVVKDYPVLLNRAPTLHRLGIQAFMPVLTENKAIQLHPMVCIPYNADFDGDQMAVYVPLSEEARMEARVLMLSARNLLLPANGKLAMAANQDIVLGSYYLTLEATPRPADDAKLRIYQDSDEVLTAYDSDEMFCSIKGEKSVERTLDLHTWIRYRHKGKFILTTVGRVIFNTILPEGVPYVNEVLNKGKLNELAMVSFKQVGQYETALLLDRIKETGFKYATRAGVTFSFGDIVVPLTKKAILSEKESEVRNIQELYFSGVITDKERMQRVVDKWKTATEQVTEELMGDLEKDRNGLNSIYMMYKSGARGSRDQIKQLGGMRGLMDKPTKSTSDDIGVIETPIKSNFKEGLSVLEYFISTHGARKGLADTALKTADAGYLTRRLVDVAQNSIITLEDCGTIDGVDIVALKEGQEIVQTLAEKIEGRTASDDIYDPITDDIIVEAGQEINHEMAHLIEKHGIISVKVRSVLTCESVRGVCSKCYGRNLATQKSVTIGEPVGIIAAQSIGEPGTQLTLRTFHIGGASSTQIENAEVVSNFDGITRFDRMNLVTNKEGEQISVSHLGKIQLVDEKDPDTVLEEYKVEYASTVYVSDNQKIAKDTRLFSWDPYNNPLISTAKGILHYENFVKDFTYKEEFNELTGLREITIIESKDRKIQPQFKIVDDDGTEALVPLPTGLNVKVEDGSVVFHGHKLGETSRVTIKQRDITGGLPRVQDLFEARVPKEKAIISEINGRVTIGGLKKTGRDIFVTPDSGIFSPIDGRVITGEADEDGRKNIFVVPENAVISKRNGSIRFGDKTEEGQDVYIVVGSGREYKYHIPADQQIIVEDGQKVSTKIPLSGHVFDIPDFQDAIFANEDVVREGAPLAGRKYVIPSGKRIIVHQGDIVESGDAISDGPLDPHDVLRVKGIKAAQMLILNEIQEIYRKQGVKIDDKHIGVIIRQMFKKVRILNPNKTLFLEGEVVDKMAVMRENAEVEQRGGEGATYEPLLLGITKTSLLTDSWLSAASFQETTKVLTQAAIEGKIDKLEGLKESIILGHRIPVGTGSKHYTSQIKSSMEEGKTLREMVQDLAHDAEDEGIDDLLDF
jgi:DNA-directed RNA polymerase subunit beta'